LASYPEKEFNDLIYYAKGKNKGILLWIQVEMLPYGGFVGKIKIINNNK
jgi:hypothetical protein